MGKEGTLLPNSCKLSRDCFNFSREYFNFSRECFSLWAIKTSLDRNASALPDPEALFSRVARHLAFCKLIKGRYFSKICAIHRLNRLVLTCLKAAANLHCQRILANAIFYCYKSSTCRLHLKKYF